MPEAFFAFLIVFTLFVLAPTAILRGIRGLRESRPVNESGGPAIRRSDLQAMIDDAVIEATAPLVARVDELERELLLGDDRISDDALAEAFDEPFEEHDEPVRRRTRS